MTWWMHCNGYRWFSLFNFSVSLCYLEVPQMSQPDMVSCHKVIVSLPSLIELLPKKCQHDCCQLPVQSNYKFGGCSVAITQTCLLGHEWVWRSGALHRDKKKAAMIANNLLLGAAILMSGNNFAKVERMFQMVNLHCISESTFYRYQRVYVAPAINQVSTEYKKQVIQRFSNADVVVSGDGRCDSPGSSAKFCTYTLMEKESGVILHTETVDKREVEYKSPNMEREALRRALKYINSTSVHVNELTTDASRSIMTMLGKWIGVFILCVCSHAGAKWLIGHCAHCAWYNDLRHVLSSVNPFYYYCAWLSLDQCHLYMTGEYQCVESKSASQKAHEWS